MKNEPKNTGNSMEKASQYYDRLNKLIFHIEHLLGTATFRSSNHVEIDSWMFNAILKDIIIIKKLRGDKDATKYETGSFNQQLVDSIKQATRRK